MNIYVLVLTGLGLMMLIINKGKDLGLTSSDAGIMILGIGAVVAVLGLREVFGKK